MRQTFLPALLLGLFCFWGALYAAPSGAADSATDSAVSPASPSVSTPQTDPDQWELTFEDNFDQPKLDESKWFPGYRLGRVEYYSKIGFPHEHTRGWEPNPPLAHYLIQDGILKLRVDKDLPKRTAPTTPTVSCLTSAIYRYNEQTKQFDDQVRFAQKYGWWEMRCKMPTCKSGAYTAFWLHTVGAQNQEYSPEGVRNGNPRPFGSPALEIDIFEWLGCNPKQNLFNIHFTPNGHFAYTMDFDITAEFHTWAINWEEGQIVWYLDGKPVYEYKGATPGGQMYLLMAMFQIGGWVGPVAKDMPYPLDFQIDYVKVWKKK